MKKAAIVLAELIQMAMRMNENDNDGFAVDMEKGGYKDFFLFFKFLSLGLKEMEEGRITFEEMEHRLTKQAMVASIEKLDNREDLLKEFFTKLKALYE